MSALVLEGVWKSFGPLEVLRGIDLAVADHEVVCLIGASGSGKSTLLRCINLLEPIDSGRIFVGAVFFVFLTIPLARYTDHLILERERRERATAV